MSYGRKRCQLGKIGLQSLDLPFNSLRMKFPEVIVLTLSKIIKHILK